MCLFAFQSNKVSDFPELLMLMFVEKSPGISPNESWRNIYVIPATQTLACIAGSILVIIVEDFITTKVFPSHLSDHEDRWGRGGGTQVFYLLPEGNGGLVCVPGS